MKIKDLPGCLRNWNILLKTDSVPLISTAPLKSAPYELCAKLRHKALNLVLAPISTHLGTYRYIILYFV